MSQYLEALQQAMFIFPIIVILFTVPYIAWSYHKYGSVLSLRVLIVYSFLLYLLCVYCLVILPLPTPEKAATLHGHKAQLIPFSFLADIVKQAEIQPGQPASWLHIFTGSAFWTTIFNLFMTMPFGVYLRYYFCYHWRKTLQLSFLLCLFFELTQLSGLYFVYPGSYRLFDVDDLIVNTAGSMIGFALAGPVSRLLPTRQELDTVSFQRGASISFTRRVFAFLADMACLIFASCILAVFVVPFGITLSIQWLPVLFLLYFGLLPAFCHGQTPGKRLTRMKIVQALVSIFSSVWPADNWSGRGSILVEPAAVYSDECTTPGQPGISCTSRITGRRVFVLAILCRDSHGPAQTLVLRAMVEDKVNKYSKTHIKSDFVIL